MNSWNKAPFVRLLIPFILGILLSVYFPLFIHYISIFVSLIFLAVAIIVLAPKLYLPYKKAWIFGIFIYTLLLLLGFQLTFLKTEIYSATHFSSISKHYKFVHCRIIEPIIEKENSVKTIVEIIGVDEKQKYIPTKGKIITHFKKTDKSLKLNYGDELIAQVIIKDIPSPQNPGEFNYKRYLSFHNIHFLCYFKDENWVFINKNSANIIVAKALELRNYLLTIFTKHKIEKTEFAVGAALLLGYEDKLDADIISAYSSTGALHVLSVSGLHVAIVFIVFNGMLFFFDKFKYGKIVKAFILLILLWFYATLTGLSPSVLRSATMFSFIIVAKSFNRNTNIYNTLAVSCFFLLLINPYLIMDVGFQLSYLAVVGIVFIQPKIYSWFDFDNKIINSIWAISTVSIAAQIATFPLGLHYFHQFPNYFLFSNLIVIPLSTIVIYLGLSIFVVAKIPFLVGYLAMVFNTTLWLLNYSVKYMERLPFALIEGISITVFETWLMYSMIITFLFYLIKRKVNYLIFALLITIGILCYQLVEQRMQLKQQKLIVYNIPNTSAIDFIKGKQNVLFTDSAFANNDSRLLFHVKHNWWDSGIDNPKITSTNFQNHFIKIKNNFIQFNDKRIGIINEKFKLIHSNETLLNIDYVIISGTPKITIKEIAKKFNPKKIIFDSSTLKPQVKKWIWACKAINLPYYSVSESGAFILTF